MIAYLFFQGNTSRKFLILLLFYLPIFLLQLSSAFAIVFAECNDLCVHVQASWYTALFRVSLLDVEPRCVGLAEKISARCMLSNTAKPLRFVKGSLRIVLPEVDSWLIENLINYPSLDGNAYRKSICKTLGKYFASNCRGLLKMLSNRLDSTRVELLVSVDVDPSYRKLICKTLRKYSARRTSTSPSSGNKYNKLSVSQTKASSPSSLFRFPPTNSSLSPQAYFLTTDVRPNKFKKLFPTK